MASCTAKIFLIPINDAEGKAKGTTPAWKIWILSTWIKDLQCQVEDPALLKAPGIDFSGLETIKTDTVIIGGGSA
jgi:hypothetical protein